jgi:hypothetical protein
MIDPEGHTPGGVNHWVAYGIGQKVRRLPAAPNTQEAANKRRNPRRRRVTEERREHLLRALRLDVYPLQMVRLNCWLDYYPLEMLPLN